VQHQTNVQQDGEKAASLIGDQPQVFQIDGNFYYQAPPASSAQHDFFPPALLPDPGIFVGRTHLLAEVERFFRADSQKVLLLEGMGGIGKTAFAAYTCKMLGLYFRDVYWHTCSENTTAERLMRELAALFAQTDPPRAEQWRQTPGRPWPARVQTLVQELTTHRYLLVLDDVQTLLDHDGYLKNPEIEQLLTDLVTTGHHSKLLLLSRRSLILRRQPAGSSLRKRLEGLPIAAAKQLLAQLGMACSTEHLRALHEKVEGHPLALRVIADLYERGLNINRLLTIPFRNLSTASKAVFDSLFAELWAVMSAEEKEVLAGVATYRVPVPFEAIQQFQSQSDLCTDPVSLPELQEVVRRLSEQCLLTIKKTPTDTKYSVPRLLREFIDKGLTKTQRVHYHVSAAQYWIAPEQQNSGIAFEGLRRQEEARYHALQAGDYGWAAKLALGLSERLCRCGLCQIAGDMLMETLERVASQEDLATLYNDLGNVSLYQGDYLQASEYYAQARQIYEDLQISEKMAISYNNIGTVCAAQGDYTQALLYYTKSRDILARLQASPDLATSYNNIGFVYASLGEYVAALKFHEQARAIQEECGLEIDLASSYNNIGFIYDCQREYMLALDYYTRAKDIRERLGLEVDLAESYNNIGSLYTSRNDFPRALHYYTQAQEILERLGLEVNLARSYNNIGLVYTAQGQLEAALHYYERAREIQERLGLRIDLARTCNNIGCVYVAQHKLSQALACYERARTIQERLGLNVHLAITFGNLGHLYYEQGHYKRAEHAMSLTIKIREQMQHPDVEHDRAFLEQIRAQLSTKGQWLRKTLQRLTRRLR
jgi:tetratricopeptide (TPR) repeat protein